MNIVFADTAHPSLMERLTGAGFNCRLAEELSASNAHEVFKEADGIVIRSRILIPAGLIDQLPRLRFIARVGAGMENIDVEHATSKGIHCLHAPEGNRNAVAEHALGMLLALMNNLVRADQEVRQGIWRREQNRGHELSGRTIGLIGFGNTGSAFAQRLSGFEVRILAYDKYRHGFSCGQVEESGMDEIYENADVLSLHVPLNTETRNLVHAEMLNRFNKPIYLVNTSRGSCVNTKDLLEAMDRHQVIGAALDVLDFETTSFEQLSGEDAVFKRLLQSEKVILSPHIAGWTFESNRRMADILFEKIMALRLKQ
jgi:D-3-phosphoglycerate dehydrogenase / 2-oxoglutarate reductase